MKFDLAFWLSMVLAIGSAFGMLLAGKQKWQGWALALSLQPVWAAFAIASRGYGLLLTVVIYTFVYTKNLRAWRTRERFIDRVMDEVAVTPQLSGEQ